MRQRTLRLIILLAGTCFLLVTTAVSAFGAGWQAVPPENTPLTQSDLEQFWQEMYPAQSFGIAAADTNVYTHGLLAKAAPDECFDGIGFPITATLPDCGDGQPKVNEAYVWGMTDYSQTIWFGTAPNVHCLVMGGFLGSTIPIQTDSYACEFGAGPNTPPLPDAIGDWRPPSVYVYDTTDDTLTDVSPNGLTGYPFDPRFVSNTLGIRSAGTLDHYVFFGGPAFTPTNSINLFLYDAATEAYLGSALKPGYGNIRKWIEVDGVLYVAVGKGLDGAVLRYTGDPSNPGTRFNFEEVGLLDADGAEIALHDGRLFVNTWPSNFSSGDIAGLWMSPVLPPTGLTTTDAPNWTLVFSYDEYEPNTVTAYTYGGGALLSYDGDLYWGTMHVPFLATLAHLQVYGSLYTSVTVPIEIGAIEAALGTQRTATIFRGHDFDTPDEEIEVLYGMPQLPAFVTTTLSWELTDTLMGPPLYGLAGFDNMYNNYTWSMAEYDGQLFVGTMDWSYLVNDIFESLINLINLPLDIVITLPDSVSGADLYRFHTSDEPAVTEDLEGVGNYTNYGIRNMLGRDDGLYLGTANPMNLLTDLTDDKPEGGWELIRMTRHLIPVDVSLGGNGSGSVASGPAGINCGASCSASYDYGSSVVLTPTANVGSAFTGWSNVCFGLSSCSFQLLNPTALTANFTLAQHTLNVALTGDGTGSVLSTPAGINCGTACDEIYNYGIQVTLTATADDGSVFSGWDGACSGTALCVVAITDATNVTATFANNLFPLEVHLTGTGSGHVGSTPAGINCGTDCEEVYDSGTQVTLTATADDGSLFSGWDGACSGTDPCVVAITDATNVTATFANNRFPLEVHITGAGNGYVASTPAGIACSQPTCSSNFNNGTFVSLSAIPFSGSAFTVWSGACSGTTTCEVEIVPGTTIVTATFNTDANQLNLQSSGLPYVGSTFYFTATLNLNPIDVCTWDFGDGTTEACDLGASAAGVEAVQDVTIYASHTYTQPGSYIVIVTASNNAGTFVTANQVSIQTPTAEQPVPQPDNLEDLFFPFLNRE